jgi:hypothetical protein
MKPIVAFVTGLLFVSPALAGTPCDFKGVSVGSKLSPAEIMSALGIAQYKTNPPKLPFEQIMALAGKYGLMAAAEIEEWDIGPFCDEKSCVVPYGIRVGIGDRIPVKATVSFHDGQITEVVVSFNKTFWDEMLPIWDEKYGADWKIEREDTVVTNYENKKSRVVEGVYLQHLSEGTNPNTKDHCKICPKHRSSLRAP